MKENIRTINKDWDYRLNFSCGTLPKGSTIEIKQHDVTNRKYLVQFGNNIDWFSEYLIDKLTLKD